MKPLLLLQTGDIEQESPSFFAKRGGNEQLFQRSGCLDGIDYRLIKVSDGEPLPAHGECSGVLITGAGCMIRDGMAWLERSAAWLREAIAAGLPVLGVCFGHQLVAHAFGGSVEEIPTGPEYGTVEIKLLLAGRVDPLFNGAPEPLFLQEAHFDTVTHLPEGATLLAANRWGGVEAFRFGPCCWGVQFHPELTLEDMEAFITDPEEGLREAGLNIEKLVEELRQTPFGPTLLRTFTRMVKEHDPAY